MGTWGAGNFEADDPREFLADMVARWGQMIDRTLAGDLADEIRACRFTAGLEALDGGVMPTVEILIAVAEKLPCDYLPAGSDVAKWTAQALRIYDLEIDAQDPDEEYKIERRAAIATTFARLMELASARERQGGDD